MKINKLEGQELLDFCRMLAGGSLVESLQDEFDMSLVAIKETTSAVHQASKNHGGIKGLIRRLEGDMTLVQKSQDQPIKPVQNAQSAPPKEPALVVAQDKTQAGLRDRLFETMDALRSGAMDAKDAAVVANLAKEICNSQRTEMDIIRMRAENAKLIEQSADRDG